ALYFFFFQAEDGIRDFHVTGVQTCALPIYSDQQHSVLVDRGHLEGAHDQHEDEQVVDAERVLGDVAGEELDPGVVADPHPDTDAEQHRAADVERDPSGRFSGRHLMRFAVDDDQVDQDEDEQTAEGGQPQPDGYGHQTYTSGADEFPEVSSTGLAGRRSRVPSASSAATAVLTTPPRGNTPLHVPDHLGRCRTFTPVKVPVVTLFDALVISCALFAQLANGSFVPAGHGTGRIATVRLRFAGPLRLLSYRPLRSGTCASCASPNAACPGSSSSSP